MNNPSCITFANKDEIITITRPHEESMHEFLNTFIVPLLRAMTYSDEVIKEYIPDVL